MVETCWKIHENDLKSSCSIEKRLMLIHPLLMLQYAVDTSIINNGIMVIWLKRTSSAIIIVAMHLCLSLCLQIPLFLSLSLSTQLLWQMDAHRELGSEVSAFSLHRAQLFLCSHFFFLKGRNSLRSHLFFFFQGSPGQEATPTQPTNKRVTVKNSCN